MSKHFFIVVAIFVLQNLCFSNAQRGFSGVTGLISSTASVITEAWSSSTAQSNLNYRTNLKRENQDRPLDLADGESIYSPSNESYQRGQRPYSRFGKDNDVVVSQESSYQSSQFRRGDDGGNDFQNQQQSFQNSYDYDNFQQSIVKGSTLEEKHEIPSYLDCSYKQDGYYADERRGCTCYYRCFKNAAIDHDCCPGTLIFNEKAQPAKQGQRPNPVCDYSQRFRDDCPRISPDADQRCLHLQNGYYANKHENCESFYRCKDAATRQLEKCPEKLRFNEDAQVCDNVGIAQCTGQQYGQESIKQKRL